MAKRLLSSVVGLAALAVGFQAIGCGTVCNLAGGLVHPEKEPVVYGGVQRDLEIIDKIVDKGKGFNCPAGGQGEAMTAVFLLGLVVVDPILSFVGDTLTLPITVLAEQWRETKKTDGEAKAPEPERPAAFQGG